MPVIGRRVYHEAMETMVRDVGYDSWRIGLGRLLVQKGSRRLYVDIAGKNLPYLGRHGEEMFPWETALHPERLDRIDHEAAEHRAESWIAFCYAILNSAYQPSFATVVTVAQTEFGARLIRTGKYRQHMRPRSPSWGVVDLPRQDALTLTCAIEEI